MADDNEISIRYVRLLIITHSTLDAICLTNYPRLAPRTVHGIISRAKADPTWRSSVGANDAEVKTLSLCLVWSPNSFYLV